MPKKPAKPKESLVDWVNKNTADLATERVRRPGITPPQMKPDKPQQIARQPKYVTLQEWAASMFSVVPHDNTLRSWARDGKIQPPPRKIGKAWQVKPDAEYFN